MLISGDQFDPRLHDPEVLVVGAGAVGIVLSVALARAGRRVLVIEAGPAEPPLDYRRRNAGPNSGLRHDGLTEGRLKALGGTTRIWGGQLAAFGPCDLAATYSGKPAWPLDWETLHPYLERALDALDVPQQIRNPADVRRRAGIEPFELGPDFEWTVNTWLPVADFTRLFGAELDGLAGLTVVTELEVVGLEFAPSGHVSAVRTRSATGREIDIIAPQVVLAAGTMEIARLLLRAAAASPSCPFADNPNIGRAFIDHLHAIVGRVWPSELRTLRRSVENFRVDGHKLSLKLRAADRFIARDSLVNCVATFNAAGSVRESLAKLSDLMRRLVAKGAGRPRAGPIIADAARSLAILAPVLWSYVVRRRSYSAFSRGVFLGLEIEQIPCARSRLYLDPGRPPAEAAIGIHWELDGRELDSAARFAERLAAAFEAHGLGRIELDPRLVERNPAMLDEFHDAYHHMGGARMGRTPEEGVVDRDLRVFGCPNLSVAGAAVFPTGSFANPTLTAIALALRLADRLAGTQGEARC